jgi:two-component system sensor histidine kinase YesM
MNWLNRFSFYTRLQGFLIALVIVPCIITTWISYDIIKGAVIEKLKANNQQLVEVIGNNLTGMIDDIAYSSNYIIQDTESLNILYYLQKLDNISAYQDVQYIQKIRDSLGLAFMKTHYLNFRIFFVTASDLAITKDATNYGDIFKQLNLMKNSSNERDANKIYWLNNKKLRQNNAEGEFLYAARIIQDPISSEVLGTLYIGIPPSYFSELFAKSSFGNLYILDDEGNQIVGNHPMIASQSLIRNTFNIPKAGWTMYYDTDQSNMMQEVSTVFFYTALLIMGCMFVFLIITVFLARSMHKPIHQLKNVALKFGAGDREVRFPVQGRDEIAELGSAFNKMLYQINQLIKNIEHEQEERRIIELQALFMQIRPHFLINTLFAIKCSLALIGDSSHSGVMDSLIRLLRAYMKANESHTLQHECALLQDYLTIMRLMNGIETKLEIHIDDRLLGLKIPRLFLQPFVENAIVHGFAAANIIDSTIRITGKIDDEDVQIKIEDNGSGVVNEKAWERLRESLTIEPSNAKTERESVGLYNTIRRLKLTFGKDAWIDVLKNDDRGLSFNLHISARHLEEGNRFVQNNDCR